MTANIILTNHFIERADQRLNLNAQKAAKQFERAVRNGVTAQNCKKTKQRRFLEHHSHNSVAYAYNDFCYITSNSGVGITVYSLPAWWDKNCYSGKKQIRNPKKYFKKYSDELEGCEW